MSGIFEIREIEEPEFLEFFEKSKYRNFLQSTDAARFRESMGEEVFLLGLFRDFEIVGAGLVSVKGGGFSGGLPFSLGRVADCQYGPLLDFSLESIENWTRGLRKWAKGKGIVRMTCNPYVVYNYRNYKGEIINDEFGFKTNEDLMRHFKGAGWQHAGLAVPDGEDLQYRWWFVKDMGFRSEEEWFESISGKARTAIRVAKKKGVRVRVGGEEDAEILHELVAESAEYHGFKNRSLRWYIEFLRNYKNAELVIAEVEDSRKKGKMVAISAGLFIFLDSEASYFMSGNRKGMGSLNGAYAIQDYIQREIVRRGIQRYNMMGFNPQFTHENGVLGFKVNFRGYVQEMVGVFHVILRPMRYNIGRIMRRFLK